METKLTGLSRQYHAALQKHLEQGPRASPQSADGLGRQALAIGLETLDLARIHEQAMIALASPRRSPGTRDGKVKRAQAFFIKAVTPIEKTHRATMEANVRLNQLNRTLRRRTVELAAANRKLKREIVRRHTVEKALKESQQHYSLLLEQSHHIHEQLRHLSRQILSAQEEERRRISRDLHDEVAQVLTGVNLHLATLKKEVTADTRDVKKKITRTQRLVEKSVNVVHRFAGQLRPPALDDLGLIPALHSYMRDFASQTGIPIRFASFTRGRTTLLDSAKRTVLYRVAQEALANVARHAQATLVKVSIQKLDGHIRMEIKDNGKSFQVQGVLPARKSKGLGLLGMRERVEMVGGRFTVESSPGKGTTIRAEIPFANGARD
ncbi:MAG: sensor histidine kinase [Sedimentisphaerales bacterium]|nr:sensor histidine kinase [Sedimentisphaerales bacterium]